VPGHRAACVHAREGTAHPEQGGVPTTLVEEAT
jgi:hypothetical protein